MRGVERLENAARLQIQTPVRRGCSPPHSWSVNWSAPHRRGSRSGLPRPRGFFPARRPRPRT